MSYWCSLVVYELAFMLSRKLFGTELRSVVVSPRFVSGWIIAPDNSVLNGINGAGIFGPQIVEYSTSLIGSGHHNSLTISPCERRLDRLPELLVFAPWNECSLINDQSTDAQAAWSFLGCSPCDNTRAVVEVD